MILLNTFYLIKLSLSKPGRNTAIAGISIISKLLPLVFHSLYSAAQFSDLPDPCCYIRVLLCPGQVCARRRLPAEQKQGGECSEKRTGRPTEKLCFTKAQ